MRERAELVRGIQAGEVSGVGLQHERKSRSVRGAHRDTPHAQEGEIPTHGTGSVHHRLALPSRLHPALGGSDVCCAFPPEH